MSIKLLTLEQYKNRYEACEANDGQLRFCGGSIRGWRGTKNNNMVICIKYYNSYQWVPLTSLSQNKFHKNADKIHTAISDIPQLIEDDLRKEIKMLEEEIKKRDKEIEEGDEKTLDCIQEYCKLADLLKNKTCVIEGCPGMCTRDFDKYNPEGFAECFCCKKKQELECPICYDTRSVSDMVCGKNCSHHICWKCYGMSCQARKQIIKCPMCRSNFNFVDLY